MAVPAEMAEMEDLEVWDPIELAAAELFGRGLSRTHVARKLERQLITDNQSKMKPVRRRMFAMRKLRRMQKQKAFRDLTWQYALAFTDARAPRILDGVTARGEAGRVDAAKFALELAGRYTPKGLDQPTAVQIVVNAVPRPVVKAQAVAADPVGRQLTAGDEEL